MNDNERRAPEWRRLLGEFFAPRLGGKAAAWAEANRTAFAASWERFVEEQQRPGEGSGVAGFVRRDREEWLAAMCAFVGVAQPHDLEATAREAQRFVCTNARSAIPGVTDRLRALAARGVRLHTASNQESWQLDAYLRGMGVRGLFDRLYGPDLVDRWKNGPHYYRAILDDSGTDATRAAVVEDSATIRAFAEACGLRAFGTLADALAALG